MLFQKIGAGAAVDAGVDAAIVERLAAAPDHRARPCVPEGEYLEGLALLRAGCGCAKRRQPRFAGG